MIPFILYTALLSFLIYYNRFFGLFADTAINRNKLFFIFLGKILAVPVFYLVYEKIYGGVFNYDAGKFYEDVQVINGFAKKDLSFYLRFLFGFQDDTPGSYDFKNVFVNTNNWDNGRTEQFLYNDNRIVIRLHSVIDWIAFNSFYVHALFNCFLSFIGIFFLYKTIRSYFEGKELLVLLILCFLPALWFYTGAPLKEGLCMLVIGGFSYGLKNIFGGDRRRGSFIILICCIFIGCFLKPYLLLFVELNFFLLFYFEQNRHRAKAAGFLITMILVVFILNAFSILFKHRSLAKAAMQHQSQFMDVARGGIFLRDSNKFLRVDYDPTLIKKVLGKKDHYTLKSGTSYTYWELDHVEDTLYSEAGNDTLKQYQLVYEIPKSGSNLGLAPDNRSSLVFVTLYHGLFSPLFFNSKNPLQWLASLENLLILYSLVVVIMGLLIRRKASLLPFVFLFMAICLCFLIAFVAPNSGAILRYRAPAVVFILLAALYYLPLKFSKEVAENKNHRTIHEN